MTELSVDVDKNKLAPLVGTTYQNDVAFKTALKSALGNQASIHEADLIKVAAKMNPILILIGILGFAASFLFYAYCLKLKVERLRNWRRSLLVDRVNYAN